MAKKPNGRPAGRPASPTAAAPNTAPEVRPKVCSILPDTTLGDDVALPVAGYHHGKP